MQEAMYYHFVEMSSQAHFSDEPDVLMLLILVTTVTVTYFPDI